MQKEDNVFFEAYKRLDTLCGDMYSCHRGVSTYIEQMEKENTIGEYLVKGWNEDYRKLKHLRWVRNQIAHESSMEGFCCSQDILDVQIFHQRILSGQDPLTMLRKRMEERNLQKVLRNGQDRSLQSSLQKTKAHSAGHSSVGEKLLAFLIFLMIVICGCLLYLLW